MKRMSHVLKFRYESPRNDRIKNINGIIGVTSMQVGIWYMFKTKRWECYGTQAYNDAADGGCSTHAPCRSFRKFKRMLRKQPEMIGVLFIASRYTHIEHGYHYHIHSIK